MLISNRLAHAELLAKMEKDDFAFSMGVRRWVVEGSTHTCIPQSSYRGIPNHIVTKIAIGNTMSRIIHT